MFKKVRLLLLLAVVTVVIAIAYIEVSVGRYAIPEGLSSYDFSIQEGQSISGVLNSLEESSYIPHAKMVQMYFRIHPLSKYVVHAGEYTLAPGMGVTDIISSLQGGTFARQLTFLEGWRREQYVQYLDGMMGREFAQEFFDMTKDAEGTLFPDTYFIDTYTTPQQLFEKITQNYHSKIDQLQDEILSSGLSEHEIVILASILERESFSNTERPVIAGILIKRLMNGWMLAVDATVQYALTSERLLDNPELLWSLDSKEWWPQGLTSADLEIDSPYNLRTQTGLTPTAIASPGFESLLAVVNYEESPYWYYLNDQKGITRFSTTLDEHNQTIGQFGISE
ncbi:endolytic transglycosylase MltG [bacterium]|uniref:Endolytic murein transglycosylase n=2 Tax=Katanobacteria TaxID=422282 RepID=A0A2M7X025_UNCKA|nr:endolytic transglycosylase MltG [bacterium]PIP56266.1 MAG: hypothetical protein COX05_03970 [candidate division WWE3 bacterium CG22_combo_CG10-13_8_21_14_all_39_12]PJA39340.1 MAG: endolytic transglycosylase MltG [candidate division WWE3 bacterium CG_4_9_14_3_um_filter_39_7]